MIFLAALSALGVGVRAINAMKGTPATHPDSVSALERQRAAVDSAFGDSTSKHRGGRRRIDKDSLRVQIDVDVATADELTQLPRVGGGLAKRIVADRDSAGPFGSLRELGRVRGLGCAMLTSLAPHVTFSLAARHPLGDEGVGDDSLGTSCTQRRLRSAHLP
jgi:hypothetical protein